jgi:uncharacterized protein YbjT (DUF2867 family)
MYVVTGATRRTGRIVARRLTQAGRKVRVLGRERKRLQTLVDLGATPFVAEPADREAMATAFSGSEAACVMLQPNYIPDSPDLRAFQCGLVAAIVPASAARLRAAEP